jgi:hypothetical protein
MNNWSEAELQFRCERLSVRLEGLAGNFLRIADLCRRGNDGDEVLVLVQTCRSFLELTAIDLDFDNAYALAQMQRQFSHWHWHWGAVWGDEAKRLEMGTIVEGWVESVRQMAGVLV